MSLAAIASANLSVDRLTEAVTVLRLTETPDPGGWAYILETVDQHAERCELLVLRGPGWFGDAYARSMTAVKVQALRIRGMEVATEGGSTLSI